jgi:DNA polymerase-3 subunit epsilon
MRTHDRRTAPRRSRWFSVYSSVVTGRGICRTLPRVGGSGFVVLDTETTGLNDPARVIELALVWVSPDGQVQQSWTTLLKGDGSSGGPRLERIHGIRDRDLVNAPEFKDVVGSLLESFTGRVVVAHNAKFDRARLNFELARIRKPGLPEMACTMYLGSHLGHGILRLDDAIDRFGITRSAAHQAHADAMATAELLGHYLSTDVRGVKSYLAQKGFV